MEGAEAASGRSPRLRAVIFDAGNTLIYMPRSAEAILQELCLQFGISLSAEDARSACRASEQYYSDHYLDYKGDQGSFWEAYHAAALASIGVEDPDGTKAQILSHGFGRVGTWQAYPDAAVTCEQLSASGLKLAVVSNGSVTVRDLLSQAGLLHFFDVVIASQDLGIQKPDPRVFHAALSALGINASDALYVGDLYDVDVVGARGAGLAAILIDREGAQAVDCPTIRSLEELLQLVRGPREFKQDGQDSEGWPG